jgi:hypothetical protein
MYGMLTKIVVKPGKRSELLEYLRWDIEVAKESEPGTWRFDVWEAEPGVVYLYEAYKDRAASPRAWHPTPTSDVPADGVRRPRKVAAVLRSGPGGAIAWCRARAG